MPLPNNINSYEGVRAVLEAVAEGGGEALYKLPTSREAIAWRHRAYKYRLLLQKKLAADAKLKDYTPATPYDNMKLTLQGHVVKIELYPQPAGELTIGSVKSQPRVKPLRLMPSVPVEPQAGEADPLTEAALQLLKEQSDDPD